VLPAVRQSNALDSDRGAFASGSEIVQAAASDDLDIGAGMQCVYIEPLRSPLTW
jgi:ABC-type taurine transport system substrate-binding protein